MTELHKGDVVKIMSIDETINVGMMEARDRARLAHLIGREARIHTEPDDDGLVNLYTPWQDRRQADTCMWFAESDVRKASEDRPASGRPGVGKQINVSMPPQLVALVDIEAGRAGVSRSEWIRQAVEDRLGAIDAPAE